ncbi:hypothetical protein Sste5346_006120 [Sporothrix stenoceras]|uniref:Major facilitator superfamily (MFS) profile domain-containing protein n=1 Tax=Sporothrix stenoceras TaxID=5173 RepID=A0ABR3Z024_9PEZI
MTTEPTSYLAQDVKPEGLQIEMTEEAQDSKDVKDFVDPTADYSGAVSKTDPREIALVRKIDFRVMPTLWCMYFMNYLDRNAVANAVLNGIKTDLGLKGTQYNTCISILFVGYIIAQVPSNMFISSANIRPAIYMGGWMAVWAVNSACTALVHNYKGLLLVRFFLGFTEAPFYPGALYLLSRFYTRKELALRISILYSGNIFATAFSGLIAAATFATLDGAHGIQGWRWLFIIEGVVTFTIALISVFLLPNSPMETRWLTPEERQMVVDRINRDTVGMETKTGVWSGLLQAVRDPRLYLFVFMQNMHLSSTSFSNFFPTVLSALGQSSIITLVLTAPPYIVAGVITWMVGISSGKFNERTWHITATMGVATVGFIISCTTLNHGARYFATFLFASGTYAVNSLVIGWIAATLGQTAEKKAVSLAIVNTFANLSYVYTSYLYPASNGPYYKIGMASSAAFSAAMILSAWALRFWLVSTNKKMGWQNGLRYAY